MLQHHYLFSAIRIPEHPFIKPKKSFDSYISELKEEIGSHQPQKVILSSEIFCDLLWQETTVLKPNFERLFDLFSDVKVLFYIRRPDKYAVSNNNTSIWYGRRKEHQLTFPDLLGWSRFFSKEQLIFRPFEKGQFIGGSIFSDFMAALGIVSREYFEFPSNNLNVSHEDDIIELMRILNNSHPDITKNNDFKYSVLSAFPEKGVAKNNFFSPKERLEIIEKYSQDIQTIAKEYMGRKDGKLFYEPLPELNEPWVPYKGLPVETVVQAFSYLIFKLQKENNDLSNRIAIIEQHINSGKKRDFSLRSFLNIFMKLKKSTSK
jgi:hypothetical protein